MYKNLHLLEERKKQGIEEPFLTIVIEIPTFQQGLKGFLYGTLLVVKCIAIASFIPFVIPIRVFGMLYGMLLNSIFHSILLPLLKFLGKFLLFVLRLIAPGLKPLYFFIEEGTEEFKEKKQSLRQPYPTFCILALVCTILWSVIVVIQVPWVPVQILAWILFIVSILLCVLVQKISH